MYKERYHTGESLGGLRLDAGLEFHKFFDYDRKAMRKALVKGGGEVRKEARRLLARAAISGAGEIPGLQTGRLRRSIGQISIGSKGGWVKYGPRTISGSVFYPAFLFYGSPKTGLAKRANYMEVALLNKREAVRAAIREALQNAVVPR
jgi:hypothetical protein